MLQLHINALVNLNGRIVNSDEALVSVFDRSYLYGDSLYEVVRTYRGEFYLLEEHLSRLQKSAELCRMALPQSAEFFRNEIYRTYEAFKKQAQNQAIDVYMRIVVSRGAGKIGFGKSYVKTPPLYSIIIQAVEPPTPEQYQQGMKVKVVDRLRNDPRALDPAMKSGNYLNSLLAYLEANEEGFEDALLCNSEGHLTEGTTFNLFYVRRGVIATPPLAIGILDGITRRKVMELAQQNQIPVREVRFPIERLYEADEVFLTSSVREVFPITQIDEVVIGSRKAGPVTQILQQLYRNTLPGAQR